MLIQSIRAKESKHYMRSKKVSDIIRQVVAMSAGMELCASFSTSR